LTILKIKTFLWKQNFGIDGKENLMNNMPQRFGPTHRAGRKL